MTERVTIGEPKPGKGGSKSLRPVRRYRKRVAELHYYDRQDKSGRSVSICWVRCTTAEFNEAKQGWRIPGDIVNAVRNYSPTHLGLIVEDGTKLLTRFDVLPPSWAPQVEGVERVPHANGLGARFYIVKQQKFAITLPEQDKREKALIDRMRIPGRESVLSASLEFNRHQTT
jgi:hypothetical protein